MLRPYSALASSPLRNPPELASPWSLPRSGRPRGKPCAEKEGIALELASPSPWRASCKVHFDVFPESGSAHFQRSPRRVRSCVDLQEQDGFTDGPIRQSPPSLDSIVRGLGRGSGFRFQVPQKVLLTISSGLGGSASRPEIGYSAKGVDQARLRSLNRLKSPATPSAIALSIR